MYQFIRDVCDKFDVEYKQNATSSNIKKVEKGLEEFGFRVEAKKEYAGNLVRTLKIPIYERGENSAGDGHAWVVDGLRIIRRKYLLYTGEKKKECSSLEGLQSFF